MMEERVGICSICGKEIVCQGGFLDGVVGEENQLYCFSCADGKMQ